MEFQETKQQMAEITSDKNKQSAIHPTSRNKETFLNNKLSRKLSYIRQGTLTKDQERKKQKAKIKFSPYEPSYHPHINRRQTEYRSCTCTNIWRAEQI